MVQALVWLSVVNKDGWAGGRLLGLLPAFLSTT